MPDDFFLLFPIPRKSLFHSVNEHDNGDFVEETKNLIANDATKIELHLFVN